MILIPSVRRGVNRDSGSSVTFLKLPWKLRKARTYTEAIESACGGLFTQPMKFRTILTLLPAVASAAGPASDPAFFENHIRPVLVTECIECHGAEKQKGDLRLDYRDGWKKGGESGAVIIPGDPSKSLFMRAIRHEELDMKMPSKRPKLSDATIAHFEQWIAAGAVDPRNEPSKERPVVPWERLAAERAKWWSLQPVANPPVPPVRDANWSAQAVDRFLLNRMEAAGLAPAPDADAAVLVRRIFFVLIGLPPSADDVSAFVKAAAVDRPAAVAALVDRLLASPRFAEHWARHWLDLMRYAETHGSEGDPEIPEMWRYRDYVIRAMNDDVPWDALIREHIAGDLLPQPRWNKDGGWNESALGVAHLRLVEHGFQPVDTRDEQVKTVDSQIDVLTKAFQGLTVSCARCHDHKFDAVSQRDYTAIAGVMESSRPAMITIDSPARLKAGADALAAQKQRIKEAMVAAWNREADAIPERLLGGRARAEKAAQLAAEIAAIERPMAELRAIARTRVIERRGKTTAAAAEVPAPIRRWSFDAAPESGELAGGAVVKNGRLILDGRGHFRSAPLGVELSAKTLEAWVSPATLDQRGGGVVGVETANGSVFDTVVFAEHENRRWMAGSNFGQRSRPAGGEDESARPGELVHLAITYESDGTIAVFRNGAPYGKSWKIGNAPVAFPKDARALVGLRHTGGGNPFFHGEVDEARIYDRALSPAQIAASYQAGPELVIVTPEELAGALTPPERARATELSERLTKAKRELEAIGPAGKDPWSGALADAEKNPANPLHGWVANTAPVAPERGISADSGLLPFRHGPGVATVAQGDFVIPHDGARAISELLPAGVGTGLLSRKHGGIASTARFQIKTDFISIRAAGAGAQCRVIVDGYPLGTNPIFPRAQLNSPDVRWIRMDTKYRRGSWAYIEFSTALDNPRRERGDERSWFFVDAIHEHDGEGPRDPAPSWGGLFGSGEPAARAAAFRDAVKAAIVAWANRTLSPEQRELLNALNARGLLAQMPDSVQPLVADFRKMEAELVVPVRIPGVVEADSYDTAFLPRGDHLKPAAPVPRGYVAILSPGGAARKASGRFEVAAAITAPQNPLTSRVMANRVWLHVFGRGIVPTPDSFGKMGELPTHPELLDHLATQFAADGWSLKKMLRSLMLTRAFQLASEPSAAATARDPGNALLSHARVRRLPAESIRDSLLAVAGRLDFTAFGPPERDGNRRSVYQSVRRNSLNPFLAVFDAPKPFSTLGRRDATNVPAQSLTMMNDPFVISCAEIWAKKAEALPAAERVPTMFVAAFGREPSPDELRAATGYAGESLRDLAHALVNAKEFIYIR